LEPTKVIFDFGSKKNQTHLAKALCPVLIVEENMTGPDLSKLLRETRAAREAVQQNYQDGATYARLAFETRDFNQAEEYFRLADESRERHDALDEVHRVLWARVVREIGLEAAQACLWD
jgi:hypothetical protein